MSLILGRLLRSNRRFAVTAPLAARTRYCHATATDPPASDSPAPGDSTPSSPPIRPVLRSESFGYTKHPYLVQGLKCHCDLEEYEDEAIAKVDMPSVGKEGLTLSLKKNALHFEGVQESDREWDENRFRRHFTGIIDIQPGVYDTDNIKATMKYGVLKLVFPKLKPEERKKCPGSKPIEFRDMPSGIYRGLRSIKDI